MVSGGDTVITENLRGREYTQGKPLPLSTDT